MTRTEIKVKVVPRGTEVKMSTEQRDRGKKANILGWHLEQQENDTQEKWGEMDYHAFCLKPTLSKAGSESSEGLSIHVVSGRVPSQLVRR